MPNMANIVLADRQATPVNHTFTPRERSNGVAVFAEASDTLGGENTITCVTKRTKDYSKVSYRINLPVTQSVQGADGVTRDIVVRTNRARIEVDAAIGSTDAERELLIALLESSLSSSQTELDLVFTEHEPFRG